MSTVSFTTQHLIRSKSEGKRANRGLIADKGYFQEYFHTLLAQRLMESGYKLRRTDRGWHQWEMAYITDREVELFSKRHELIDTLSEESGSTPEEETRIAHQERDSKTSKLFHGKAEIENWRQQMRTRAVGFGAARTSKRGASTRDASRSARGRGRSLLREAFCCARPGTNSGDSQTGLRYIVSRRSGAVRQKPAVRTARRFARYH